MNKSVWRTIGQTSRAVIVLAMAAPVLSFGGCTAGDGDPVEVGTVGQKLTLCRCVPIGECDSKENPCVEAVFKCSSGTTPTCNKGETVCESRVWGVKDEKAPACETLDGAKGFCTENAEDRGIGCCTGCVTEGERYYKCNDGKTPLACGVGGQKCINCDDEKPCALGCKEGKCVEASRDGTACTFKELDGTCLGTQCCTEGCDRDGKCVPFAEQKPTVCGAAGEACINCDDDDPCTVDYCESGGCQHKPLEDGDKCDNGIYCDGPDVCMKGECNPVAGKEPCTQGEQCRHQTCNEEKDACQWVTDGGKSCNDGDPCTDNDECGSNAECHGTPRVCEDQDGNPCTDERCVAGKCVPEDVPNEEERACTEGCIEIGVCVDGHCAGDGACEDRGPCIEAGCDAGVCVYTPREGAECATPNHCVKQGYCVDVGGGEFECQDSTEDVDQIECFDDNGCTNDTCDPDVGCEFPANVGQECADLDHCTTGDQCREDGTCSGSEVECEPTNDCRVTTGCDPLSGCTEESKPDGDPCVEDGADGNCQNGFCIVPTPPGGGGAGGAAATGGAAGTGTTAVAGATTAGAPASSAGAPSSAAGTPSNAAGAPSGAGMSTSSAGTPPSSAGRPPSSTAGTTAAAGRATSSAGRADNGGAGTDVGNRYQRDPAGCACRAAGDGSGRAPYGLALLLGSVALAFTRRRRQR